MNGRNRTFLEEKGQSSSTSNFLWFASHASSSFLYCILRSAAKTKSYHIMHPDINTYSEANCGYNSLQNFQMITERELEIF